MIGFDRITINPASMNGQPCIRGQRLTVRRVLEIVALYPNRIELSKEFPEIENEDIRQALAYAAAKIKRKWVKPLCLGCSKIQTGQASLLRTPIAAPK